MPRIGGQLFFGQRCFYYTEAANTTSLSAPSHSIVAHIRPEGITAVVGYMILGLTISLQTPVDLVPNSIKRLYELPRCGTCNLALFPISVFSRQGVIRIHTHFYGVLTNTGLCIYWLSLLFSIRSCGIYILCNTDGAG